MLVILVPWFLTLILQYSFCCMIPYKFKGASVPISCVLAFCVGKSCHCIFYHDLARFTIYGTTTKRPICISGHWYIFNGAASTSNWGEQRRLKVNQGQLQCKPGTYCREWLAFFRGARVVKLNVLAIWFKCTGWIATYLACIATYFWFL